MRITRRIIATLVVAVVAAACSDEPTGNRTDTSVVKGLVDRPHALGDINLACTIEWANAVDGLWEDSTKWWPARLPNVNDSVCLTAVGTFTVTLSSSQSVHDMQVGAVGWSTATLHLALPPGDSLHTLGGFGTTVKQGSTILFDGTNNALRVESSSGLTNDGLIRVSNSCSCANAATISTWHLNNHGTLHLAGAGVVAVDYGLNNDGIISVTAPFPARLIGNLWQEGGSIVGTQYLNVLPRIVMGSVAWSGGRIEANANDSTKPVVRTFGTRWLDLRGAPQGGRLDVSGDFAFTQVWGSVPTGVHLRLLSVDDHEFAMSPDLAPGGDFVVRGTLEFVEDPAFATGHDHTVTGEPVINYGQIKVTGGQRVELTADSTVNAGAMLVNGKLRVNGSQHFLRNKGSIVVGSGKTLEMATGTSYHAAAGSTMMGRLLLTNATLQGLGSVGDVESVSGSIRPGSPIGTLAASSVTFDATSGLSIDVSGTSAGTFDQLAVAGNITYGGTLTISTLAPFVGGMCGQVVPIITDQATAPRGAFNKYVGLMQSGLVNRWRTHSPTGLYQLVGYNPLTDVYVNQSSLAVTEAGARSSYTVCLGPSAPNANVVVTPTPALGEIGATPTPLTFTTTNWLLPQTVTVSALDDAVVDSLVTDTLANTVSSADPRYAGAPTGSLPVVVTDNDGNADVGIAFSDVPPTIVVGQEFNARYIVSNAGPTLSTGITLSIPALTGLEYVSVTGGTCTPRGASLTCALPGVAPGSQYTLTFRLRALTSGTHTTTLTIAGQQPDANSANNSAVRDITVN